MTTKHSTQIRRYALTALTALMGYSFGLSCTSFLVGKKASADGSAFITYNADDYGMYGRLLHYPAAKHAKGTMRQIVDGDTNKPLGEIPEAAETYNVMGNINEYQVAITESTFGGRSELVDTTGTIDYVSLMAIALQRSKTAREAIKVMTSLVEKYGYASSGESFSIADPNEVWIMEMIGKGTGNKGAVWVAVRIPDDCISAHANQSRIRTFNQKDKQNVFFSKDVISFARKKGYFSGKDKDFDFSKAYAPADFSALRFCEARVWSFFNKWSTNMDKYLSYASGKDLNADPMPLYIKPDKKLALKDVIDCMRDHYENTPFDITHDAGAGAYSAPYRPTPLTWKSEGKTYFNERPISTQQTGYTVIAQLRSWLPNAIGGILWFGNDDPNMISYTPVYCSATNVPKCYDKDTADGVTFSWKSAFWVCNWVANMTYPRYSMLFPTVRQTRDKLDKRFEEQQKGIEQEALEAYKTSPEKAKQLLDQYTGLCAELMLHQWKELGMKLIVKYNDQAIKPEENGEFTRTPYGLGTPPKRVGFDENFRKVIVKETGDKYLVPDNK